MRGLALVLVLWNEAESWLVIPSELSCFLRFQWSSCWKVFLLANLEKLDRSGKIEYADEFVNPKEEVIINDIGDKIELSLFGDEFFS